MFSDARLPNFITDFGKIFISDIALHFPGKIFDTG
jgi:hypothetical protein